MDYDVEKVAVFTLYSKLKIFNENLFDFSEDLVCAKFDHSWDRGSFVNKISIVPNNRGIWNK